jgi:hypothetical protein
MRIFTGVKLAEENTWFTCIPDPSDCIWAKAWSGGRLPIGFQLFLRLLL